MDKRYWIVTYNSPECTDVVMFKELSGRELFSIPDQCRANKVTFKIISGEVIHTENVDL